jgi:hypothetical protein
MEWQPQQETTEILQQGMGVFKVLLAAVMKRVTGHHFSWAEECSCSERTLHRTEVLPSMEKDSRNRKNSAPGNFLSFPLFTTSKTHEPKEALSKGSSGEKGELK